MSIYGIIQLICYHYPSIAFYGIAKILNGKLIKTCIYNMMHQINLIAVCNSGEIIKGYDYKAHSYSFKRLGTLFNYIELYNKLRTHKSKYANK
jgi:hypothetical protein